MTEVDIHIVRKALGKIKDPQSGGNILDSGRVQGLTVKDGRVGFAFQTSREQAEAMEKLREKAEKAVRKIKGVSAVTAVLTAHSDTPAEEPAKAKSLGRHGTPPPPKPKPLPGVDAVIAVASGKGGVGKSTIAANLAVALAKQGKRVGLMDADIYGPSAPILLGLQGQKPKLSKEEKIIPLEAHGVKTLSMGFMVGDGQAVIWRGPMIIGALQQMFADTDWGGLDVLIVDMPPGTGDAQLTLVQTVNLAGAVIAATPQEVALADVRRGVHMFRKANVPILGVVENMAGYIHPATGERIDIFGAGGAKRTADELEVAFLGEIPLDPALREASDNGTPPATDPDSPLGKIFADLADSVMTRIAQPQ
jgi:ATP-binding protein involved in chromosome partitioning